MIRGLIIGEVVTIVIIGGLWLWLTPRLWVDKSPVSSSTEGANTASVAATSTFKTLSTAKPMPAKAQSNQHGTHQKQ